jgi:hypothetical protein
MEKLPLQMVFFCNGNNEAWWCDSPPRQPTLARRTCHRGVRSAAQCPGGNGPENRLSAPACNAILCLSGETAASRSGQRRKGAASMEWVTPQHEEIDLNCEVSSYANAEL